jgi:hypothetical protein
MHLAMAINDQRGPVTISYLGQIAHLRSDGRDVIIFRGHVGQHPAMNPVEMHHLLQLRCSSKRHQLRRHYPGEQVARTAHQVRNGVRLRMVSTNQAPQLSVTDDGNRHRRKRIHVAHILQVDRRDAAQQAHR